MDGFYITELVLKITCMGLSAWHRLCLVSVCLLFSEQIKCACCSLPGSVFKAYKASLIVSQKPSLASAISLIPSYRLNN